MALSLLAALALALVACSPDYSSGSPGTGGDSGAPMATQPGY